MSTNEKLTGKATFTKVEKLFLTSYIKGTDGLNISWKQFIETSTAYANSCGVVAYFDFESNFGSDEVVWLDDLSVDVSNYLRHLSLIDHVVCRIDEQCYNLCYNKFMFGAAIYRITKVLEFSDNIVIQKRSILKPGEYYGTLKVISYNEKIMMTYSIKIIVSDRGTGVVLNAEPISEELINSEVLATSLDSLINSMMMPEVSLNHEERNGNCISKSRIGYDSLEDEER